MHSNKACNLIKLPLPYSLSILLLPLFRTTVSVNIVDSSRHKCRHWVPFWRFLKGSPLCICMNKTSLGVQAFLFWSCFLCSEKKGLFHHFKQKPQYQLTCDTLWWSNKFSEKNLKRPIGIRAGEIPKFSEYRPSNPLNGWLGQGQCKENWFESQ